MSNPPIWGRDDGDASEGSLKSHGKASHKGNAATRPNRSPKSKLDARQQAINDANHSLQSLINPQTSDGHPRIISSSGAIHRSHGRVVGPTSDRSHKLASPSSDPALAHIAIGPGTFSNFGPVSSLPAIRGASSAPDDSREEVQPVQNTRLERYAARASGGLATARKQAGLFLGEPGSVEISQPAPDKPTASRWVARHATFVVVMVLVAVVAGAGGIKVFGAHSDVNHDLASSQAYTGNDLDEIGYNDTNLQADAGDFQLALPRTQVSSSAGGSAGQGSSEALPPDVTQYTVAEGDTVQTIASHFNVLPETVMGSNGIFDSQENLAPGRVLVIPPVDGMYYVAQKGDTLDKVAQRFQVEPDAITSYKRNIIDPDGSIKEGQVLVVPGGMIPERETVITYTVRRGDTLKGIAARFQIDVPTMINSNNIPNPDSLQPGSQLRVLPVPGMEYKVKKGDSITAIAAAMGVSPQMILDYQPNHLNVDSTLQIDQVILVPGGDPDVATGGNDSAGDNQSAVAAARIQPDSRSSVRPEPQQSSSKGDGGTVKPKSDNSGSGSGSKPAPQQPPAPKQQPKPKQDTTKSSSGNSPKSGTGHLIWPVHAVITQYFSAAHNGLDLATSAGTPIHAADAGKVVWAGWRTDGLGYCVIIDHLDGLTTVYGHQIRQPLVHVGQYVSQGQVIGWVGSTGHSTGPHVHFMVKVGGAGSHSYRNPLAFLGR